MIHNFYKWIGPHIGPDLYPNENLWDVLKKALRTGPTLPFMQHWMEINSYVLEAYQSSATANACRKNFVVQRNISL